MRDIKELYKADYPQEVFIRRILSAHIQVFFEKYLLPLAHRNMRVLDVGCGEQPFRSVIEQYGFCYKGLDRRQNSKQNVDIIVPIDDPLFDNYSIEPFDFVLCTEVLEHVANWEVAFKNIAKLTKKNGVILITCPHFYQLHEEPYDFWRPTTYSIEYYAGRNDLKVIEMIKAGNAWDVLGTLLTNTYFTRNSSDIRNRVLFRAIKYIYQWLVRSLMNGSIQKDVGVHSPLYLSNIAILEKQ